MKFEQTLNSSQKEERAFPRGDDRRPLDFQNEPIVVICLLFEREKGPD